MPQRYYPRPKLRAQEIMDHHWKQSKGEAHFSRDIEEVKSFLATGRYGIEDMTKLYAVGLKWGKDKLSGKEEG